MSVWVACDPQGESDDDADESEPFSPVPVDVDEVVSTTLRRTVVGNTTLASALEMPVVSEIDGTVRSVLVQEGDEVVEGARLAEVVNEDVRIRIREAEQAVERFRREVEALRPLYEQGYLARQAFDEAAYQLETAETNLSRVREAASGQTVRSPIAGVVVARHAEVGGVVVPNQTLFEVTVLDRLEARVAVPERELLALAVGQPAEVQVEAFGGAFFDGHVERIDPIVDPQTGTVRVRVAMDELQREGLVLRPGMFVGVRIVTDVHENAAAMPKRAVVREAGSEFVFAIRDAVERPPEGTGEGSGEVEDPFAGLTPYAIERVPVTLGFEDRAVVEVLAGVDIGERVIVVGQSGLDPSAIVVIPADAEDVGDGTSDGSGGAAPR